MDIYQQKKILRKKIREIKKQYSLEQKRLLSLEIWSQLEETIEFQKADYIMAYWSMDDEVYTHRFIRKWADKKQIILPVIKGDELELKLFRGLEELVEGEQYGILEPDGAVFREIEKIELVLVPGMAFDNHNNRMGRGKAYYDQLLVKLNAIKIGICFDFQLLEEVPHNDLDVKMDRILTNKK